MSTQYRTCNLCRQRITYGPECILHCNDCARFYNIPRSGNSPSLFAMHQKIMQYKLENDKLKKQNKLLRQETEEYRFAAIALKNLAANLPPARINQIEWTKKMDTHLTIRSTLLDQQRTLIQQQRKYATLIKNGQYIIENNPESNGYECSTNELHKCGQFVSLNHIGNVNPMILYRKDKTRLMNNILGIRKIKTCNHLPCLVGQRETFAKVAIDEEVILGQYVGNEMMKEEFDEIYSGTKEELKHSTYNYCERLLLPNNQIIDIFIDGIAAGESSPMIYVNDGRVDIRKPATESDKDRINTEYVSILVNGYPMILMKTTKKIKKGEALWINYGNEYSILLEQKDFYSIRKAKTLTAVNYILCQMKAKLNEKKPIQIFDDDDDESDDDNDDDLSILENGNAIKRKRDLMMDNGNDTENTNNGLSPLKKRRVEENEEKENKEEENEEDVDGLICNCRTKYDGRYVIRCDFCFEWYHPYCIGIDEDEHKWIMTLEKWNCGYC